VANLLKEVVLDFVFTWKPQYIKLRDSFTTEVRKSKGWYEESTIFEPSSLNGTIFELFFQRK
jgi:hypothetical protein